MIAEMSRTTDAAPVRTLPGSPAHLREIPYPYRALLAICSDLDETPDRRVYMETLRFLNTTETTCMGPGVGLETGNTIYFDMPPRQFAYWNTDDAGRAMLRALMQSGHIDCLHSYGDLATTRAHAARALEELTRHGCRLEVWIDHAVAPTNFGADIMRGTGDVPGSPAFHADLTCAYGVKYVWRGRVTSVIGQRVTRRLSGIYSPRHPVGSLGTISRELAKGALARFGHRKYQMHSANDVLRRVQLRSGEAVYELLRANPHWGGVSCGETAAGLAGVLTDGFLDSLEERRGTCVLYTHLGKVPSYEQPLPPESRSALRRLAQRYRAGGILVTTTRRLLAYAHATRNVVVGMARHGDWQHVDVTLGADRPSPSEEDLAGLCVYVPDPAFTRLRVNGRDVTGFVRNPADETGRRSISLPWTALELPRV